MSSAVTDSKNAKSVPGPENPSTKKAYLKFEKDTDVSLERAKAFAISLSESKDPLKYANKSVNFRPSNLKVFLSFLTDDSDEAVEEEDCSKDDVGPDDFDAISVDENGYCYYTIRTIK